MSEGTKHDQGKLRFDLIPVLAEAELVEVITFGANKYAPNNWRKLKDPEGRWIAAALRHISQHRTDVLLGREPLDAESGLPHLAHAACSIMFLLELYCQEQLDLDVSERSPQLSINFTQEKPSVPDLDMRSELDAAMKANSDTGWELLDANDMIRAGDVYAFKHDGQQPIGDMHEVPAHHVGRRVVEVALTLGTSVLARKVKPKSNLEHTGP